MTEITHIFFDLHGTLVDGVKLHPCYTENLGRVMAERYGSAPETWIKANRLILEDWDSYYADLDLGGEDGIAQMFEGLYRTTRAMFRLSGVAEPPQPELTRLSRELPGLVTITCDAFYPDAHAAVKALHAAAYVLGVTSHALRDQARGLVRGAGVLDLFAGPIIGADTAERYEKDRDYFLQAALMAGVSPSQCLVVDDVPRFVNAAKGAGMQTAQIIRKEGQPRARHADIILEGDLGTIMRLLP